MAAVASPSLHKSSSARSMSDYFEDEKGLAVGALLDCFILLGVPRSGKAASTLRTVSCVWAAVAEKETATEGAHAAAAAAHRSPNSPKAEVIDHFDVIVELSGHGIRNDPVVGKCIYDTWDFLSLSDAQSHLNAGNSYFRFLSGSLINFGHQDLDFINTFINLSGFADETKDNYAPFVDAMNPQEQTKYVAILVKAMYLLPGAKVANMDQELIASLDYNRCCQPGDVKFEDKDVPPRTFREVKTIVKWVYWITIQMYVSEIVDPMILFALRECNGVVPTKAIILERTKRDPTKVDSTTKVKSLLLYYSVDGGVLVSHSTIVLNTTIPTLVMKILNTFGSQGTSECAQTAEKTRAYLISRFGDSRRR